MSAFAGRVTRWQERHGRRGLPWQGTREPYRVWLSEIMLQQTQVSAAIPYYLRFLERFPDVAALAAAPPGDVLEAWAGLGYYARARNLHRCARTVVADFAGRFPADIEKLAALPGIGRSTAAAIGVFAFGIRAAILDGNVKRVLARHFGVEGYPGRAEVERALWRLAESLLPHKRVETYTQGLMDLGATVCTRANPKCDECPLRADCVARREARQAELPAPRPARALPERETRVLALIHARRVLLERRPPAGLWGGLLTLPELGSETPAAFARRNGLRLGRARELPPLRHAFSHFRLTLRPWLCPVEAAMPRAEEPGREWLPLDSIEAAALPTPIRRILEAVRLTTENTEKNKE
ncbi:MAG: A/G-specific adenine glycosylase [Candidatus Accumulibacter sp.]|nr:A/G-specific adenine glycosylase [Accumulibacter sp.]